MLLMLVIVKVMMMVMLLLVMLMMIVPTYRKKKEEQGCEFYHSLKLANMIYSKDSNSQIWNRLGPLGDWYNAVANHSIKHLFNKR